MHTTPTREEFLKLPTEEVARLVSDLGRPRVGIFVLDGSRRLVLSTTDLEEGSDEFFTQVALTQTACGLDTLKVFFSHGLPVLFVPLFSHSVLTRGSSYRHLTILKTLNIILTSENWLDFYNIWDVRVRVYGDLSVLAQADCEEALQWIENVQQITQKHAAHTLFLGIGNKPLVGHDAAIATARFYQKYQREPSTDELIEFLYGRPVPLADFFIMSSKFGGLGALPALICGGDTQVYYLPAPGVMALTKQTYRAILYDLLYMRDGMPGECCYALASDEREQLRAWYAGHAEAVIGLGHRIGSVWVPEEPAGVC
jgi:hypothetical protein